VTAAALADVEWLRRRHVDDGVDAIRIAAELGVSKVTVYKALRRHGLWRPTRRRIDRDWLWRRYVEEGATAPELAAEAGVTKQGVYWALRREGIDLEDRGVLRTSLPVRSLPIGPLVELVERHREDLDETGMPTMSWAELARRAGYWPRSLHQWKAAGLVPPAAADRLACALGTHPVLIWPEEWPAALGARWRGDRSQPGRTVPT
jgi:lambda repressor-like predicted transcriptional regulator/DNA-binding phage protein